MVSGAYNFALLSSCLVLYAGVEVHATVTYNNSMPIRDDFDFNYAFNLAQGGRNMIKVSLFTANFLFQGLEFLNSRQRANMKICIINQIRRG